MQNRKFINYLPYLIVIASIICLLALNTGSTTENLNYNEFYDLVEKERVNESVLSIGYNVIEVRASYGEENERKVITANVPNTTNEIERLIGILDDSEVRIIDANASNAFLDTLYSMIPLVFVVLFGLWMVNRMNGSGSANAKAFEFGKSRARLEESSRTRFTDVAGCDEEKQEMEIGRASCRERV